MSSELQKTIVYVGGPDLDEAQANAIASDNGWGAAVVLGRRGYQVGWVSEVAPVTSPDVAEVSARWQAAQGIVLPGFLSDGVRASSDDIKLAQALMERVLAGDEVADVLEGAPYADRLQPKYELLSSTYDEGDDQEIQTLEFDVMDGEELLAEGLWVKASWLSYEDEDTSLRFRFSFGLVGYEDVAADYERQLYAAEVTECVFPESAVISQNEGLKQLLLEVLSADDLIYVERIVYFNAPNGGAQMHQDVERGHAGVVYLQVSGSTLWFALSKAELISEIQAFMAQNIAQAALARCQVSSDGWALLQDWVADASTLSAMLDERDNEPLDVLINQVPEFARQLIEAGYASLLSAGDVMLLPQQGIDHCAWHCVYCVGGESGEALSFAIRGLNKV